MKLLRTFGILSLSLNLSILGMPLWGAGAPGTESASEKALPPTFPGDTTPSQAGITLAECYAKARSISENVGISAETTRMLQAETRASIGSILPHIDWIKTQMYQENVSEGGSTNATNSSLLAVQPESYFQLQQPIFAGFRDFAAIEIAKSQELQARINQVATNLQLLADVAVAFYTAYTLQDQLSVLQETRKFNQEQIDLLTHWEKIGRSRSSEVLSAQTLVASLDAQIAATRRQLKETRHLLFFLTGVPADVPLKDDPPAQPTLSMEEALTRAEKRPDILSVVESAHQADLGLRYAQGSYYPSLYFLGRAYTERVGFLEDVHWDATFHLDVPLFQGGTTRANVLAARSQQLISRFGLARVQRVVDREVRTAYDDLFDAITEYTAYERAVQLAQKNYQVQQKEYRLGVITNLELLSLLTNMQNVRGQWLVSRANAQLDHIRLRIAMGESL